MTIPWLDADDPFPPVDRALVEPNGLLAAGGDLSPERLLDAYARGIFPWFNEDDPVLWWSPDPRMVLFPRDVHVSRSLRRTIRSGRFTVTFDYGRQRLIFEPNADFAKPDVWDRAGLWINRTGDGFEIKDVVAGGPAAAAGLHAGDIIVSLDGKTAKELSLADARKLLKGAPGTKVNVGLRGAQAVLVLRDLI